ncbi:hypothetical protein O4H52_00980 [Sphingomonadaceae bacterium G21617-S1]|nr:hypothetical protein [Sphingomonadaceae bacterium G21617-S1]
MMAAQIEPPAGISTIGQMEPIRIGATGACMTLAAVEAWAKSAAPGDSLKYAEGSLPKWSKVLPFVRDLAVRDIVFAWCDGGRRYWIKRLAKPYSSAPQPVRLARDIPPRDADMARLLSILTGYARKGVPCPSNRDLARRAELSNGDRASYLIKCLVGAGYIRCEVVPAHKGWHRIITIVGVLDGEGRDIRTADAEAGR